MLELPESHAFAKQIDEVFAGKTIKTAIANQSPHGFAWYTGDPASYQDMLGGLTIQSAGPIGGNIEITAGEMLIVLGDGINMRYIKNGEELPKKHQLLLEFTDGDALVCTVAMYGGMWAYPRKSESNSYLNGSRRKPTPYSDEFDRAYFDAIVEKTSPKLSVKALLATEQRIPGLGNGCLQDILFNARLNPQTKLNALDGAAYDALYSSVKTTLADMRDKGGRNVEKNIFGEPGGYETILSAKTLAYPCPVCGAGIVRKAYMGGNVYFCPNCQPV